MSMKPVQKFGVVSPEAVSLAPWYPLGGKYELARPAKGREVEGGPTQGHSLPLIFQ